MFQNQRISRFQTSLYNAVVNIVVQRCLISEIDNVVQRRLDDVVQRRPANYRSFFAVLFTFLKCRFNAPCVEKPL